MLQYNGCLVQIQYDLNNNKDNEMDMRHCHISVISKDIIDWMGALLLSSPSVTQSLAYQYFARTATSPKFDTLQKS